MSRYYDREGNPILGGVEGFMAYMRKFETEDDFLERKRVAYTEVSPYRVSTVWRGINHRFGDGPPLIFETMVFKMEDFEDLACERYSTEDEAIKGHGKMVKRVQEAVEKGVSFGGYDEAD